MTDRLPLPERAARTIAGSPAVRGALTKVHRAAYSITGGRLGADLGGLPMLLLTTTGRRSGEPRTQPLLYLEDGDDYVVIASNWGGSNHPAWYLNLVAQPDAEVQVGGTRHAVRAEEVTGEERDRLWRRAVDTYGDYERYAAGTDRTIPVLRLVPTDRAAV